MKRFLTSVALLAGISCSTFVYAGTCAQAYEGLNFTQVMIPLLTSQPTCYYSPSVYYSVAGTYYYPSSGPWQKIVINNNWFYQCISNTASTCVFAQQTVEH